MKFVVSFLAESKLQHSISMQEDAWDSDWDLHDNLFKEWIGIRDRLGNQ